MLQMAGAMVCSVHMWRCALHLSQSIRLHGIKANTQIGEHV